MPDPMDAQGDAERSRAGQSSRGAQIFPPQQPSSTSSPPRGDSRFTVPQIALPKGGGAIRGIGEKFTANPATGTGSFSIPIAASPGRQEFGPQLGLAYDSGSQNGPFGFGWSLSLPEITRRTDKGLPRYRDSEESDTFLISGAEDLVPVLTRDCSGRWIEEPHAPCNGYTIKSYRPRIEGLFARIERWTRDIDGDQHWRSISKDNVVTFYGLTDNARIADPDNPFRVFRWLICASYDDKGNAIVYDYVAENDAGVDHWLPNERHRRRAANRYVKRVRYGNRVPLHRDAARPGECALHFDAPHLDAAQWLFSVLFDYDEGHYCEDAPDDGGRMFCTAHIAPRQPWSARPDPFSSYRSGFEIRTYRLCSRAMVFHHFAEELGVENCLVRSIKFDYRKTHIGSFLERVVQSGHKLGEDGRYVTTSLPALDLTYTRSPLEAPHVNSFKVTEVEPASLANLPAGVDGNAYRWADLDGEGIAGVLSEQRDAWFYKHNLGAGRLGATEVVRTSPIGAQLNAGRRHLMDVAGDGNLDLVDFAGSSPGFYERTSDHGWGHFRTFGLLPNLNWADPNLRFIDLTGDGIADVLITEDDAFIWHPSLLERGFGAGVRVRAPLEKEETGPRVIFADGTQSIYTADMSGDGLSDILRIRNGEICYWPNIGYGRFGAKITMDNAPWFDAPDLFDQRRIRLADIDGSGSTDIIYLKPAGVDIYLNHTGNGWSTPWRIDEFPAIDNVAEVSVTDFLGRGTACLLWSSPLPSNAGQQLRYIDLMCGRKPHLLATIDNNMGAQTRIEYASSTEFYLADKAAGTPWITRLPFPVHVVKRVETFDGVSRNRFVSSYSYHHGFYDGLEREFRGFGRVDQLDTESIANLNPQRDGALGENFDAASIVPPVLTKTWFHTGVYLAGSRVSRQLAHEYYGAGDGEHDAPQLDDTILPHHLTPFEAREACRALKGAMLRQEIYALDGSAKEPNPYRIAESNFTVVALQPRLFDRYAVFFTHPREAFTLSCERNPADPRLSHTLTLEVDDFGNVLKSVAIGYARRKPENEEQSRTLGTLSENRYTNAVREHDAYRTPAIAEAKTYELTAPELVGAKILDFAAVRSIAAAAHQIAYEERPTLGQMQKRLIERTRTLYRSNDLAALLPPRELQSLALPGANYKLAFTPGLLEVFQTKASAGEVAAMLGSSEGGYRDLDGDGAFWVPSGRLFYSPDPSDDAAAERAFARAHFLLPHRYEDPFGAVTTVGYDGHGLYATFMRDPVGNETMAQMNYRVLQPRLIVDPNGNRSRARFDALGRLVGTVVQGKADGPIEGDSFDEFVSELSPRQIKEFFAAADPRSLAIAHLGTATTRLIYGLDRFPVCAASIARETHISALSPGQQTRIQLNFVYSDGFARVAQTKIQAEPGPLDLTDPEAPIQNPRWVGTGATIYDNKGNPVRRYEPFFSSTPQYGIERWGVSDVLFYDPAGRVIATLHPNHTFEKVVFDAWRQISYDANDTVLTEPQSDPDVGGFIRLLPEKDYLPTWYEERVEGGRGPHERQAAEKAARHADTPTTGRIDSLGRVFLSIADSGRSDAGESQLYATRMVLDIKGQSLAVIDALGRTIVRYDYDMMGTRLRQHSMEAGERWVLNDAAGQPLRTWNSRGYAFRIEYDELHRPAKSFVRGGTPSEQYFAVERMFLRAIYGDSADTELSEAERRARNLRTRLYRQFDGAGVAGAERYDFKGNLLGATRRFAVAFREPPDWAGEVALQSEAFETATAYDALNRAAAMTAPDGSVYRPRFNDASQLKAVDVNIRGARQEGRSVWSPFVHHINYDAKGQRQVIRYGNGAVTEYEYERTTFRLLRLHTKRVRGGPAAALFKDAETVQDLHYVYDPVGNITRIEDTALDTVFHGNRRVEALSDYTYDPLYRLLRATGREHAAQASFSFEPADGDYRDYPFVGAAHLHDLQALRDYTEHYEYSPVNNLVRLRHHASDGNFERKYAYESPSLLEPCVNNNRLSHTSLQDGPRTLTERYCHDAHGNVTQMPHLPCMAWDFLDRLRETQRQVVNHGTAEATCYVYDSIGQRARKITLRHDGSRLRERCYIGGFEIFRTYRKGHVEQQRETLHVMDETRRIALIETLTVENGRPLVSAASASRYQFGNGTGSTSLELDEAGGLLTYEEYSPYGNSTFQAGDCAEVSLKRYRYTGKERDEENGFNYHGVRYYAPWLGRWTSCDPAGLADGPNLFAFTRGNPIRYSDGSGTQCDPTNSSCVDPTSPTPREEALQQSLPEDERNLSPVSEAKPPPNPDDVSCHQEQSIPPPEDPRVTAYRERVQRYQAIFAEERERGWWDRTFHKNTQEEREAHEWLSAEACPECDRTAPPEVLHEQLANYRLGLGLIGAANAATIYAASGAGLPGAEPIDEEPIVKAPPTPQVEDDVLQNPQAMAPLNAEQLGGQRVWVVGPEGASSTRAIRIRGNLVTYDTTAPGDQGDVRADMKVIANIFNSQGASVNRGTPGIWWTGTHGTPEGNFGEAEYDFLKKERGYGPFYGWSPLNARAPDVDFRSNPNTPTVMNWCFSSAWCITNAH